MAAVALWGIGLVLAVLVVQLAVGAWALGKAGVARLVPCEPGEVDKPPRAAIDELVARGFLVVGAYRVVAPRAPDAFVVIFVAESVPLSARVWAAPPNQRTPVAAIVSRVGAGRLATSTQPGSLHLRSALEQSVRFTTWDDLIAAHQRAVAEVARHGVVVHSLDAAAARALFAQEWAEEADVVRAMPRLQRFMVAAMQLRGHRTGALVEDQPDIVDRLAQPPFR